MKLAYTTTFSAEDVHNWSGTPYYMAKAFQTNHEVSLIGSLKRQLPPFFKIKQVVQKYVSSQRMSPRFNVYAAKHYSEQVAQQLKNISADVIISPRINPIAYLDVKQPLVLWTDATYAGLLGFYEPFSTHSTETIRQGNAITQACLERCRLAIFSSDWAAMSAIELYGMRREKVKVVPFGANIASPPTLQDVQGFIKKRSAKKIKLLFLAKSWERKGGDIVLAVAKQLHEAGYPVELTLIGYCPKHLFPLPAYVNYLGFISKHTPQGLAQIQRHLSESHFLFVPSRAEAFGIVFCEANAFGVPCLTTHVGGIATVVKDGVNGKTFASDAKVQEYCEYITEVVADEEEYQRLALSSLNEFQTRLNWNTATAKVEKVIHEIGS